MEEAETDEKQTRKHRDGSSVKNINDSNRKVLSKEKQRLQKHDHGVRGTTPPQILNLRFVHRIEVLRIHEVAQNQRIQRLL